MIAENTPQSFEHIQSPETEMTPTEILALQGLRLVRIRQLEQESEVA